MARRWFSRKSLTCESEEFNVVVNDLDRIKVNGYRILTTQDVTPEIEMGEIGDTPNANGGTISEGQLILQPASASFGGLVTTGAQTFSGLKTFSDGISASGLVTGVTTIGSSPNANGASISGSNLLLQPASASFGGAITTGAQSFSGLKTFSDGISTTKVIPGGNKCIDISDGTIIAEASNRTILGTSSTTSCYLAGVANTPWGDVNAKIVLVDTDGGYQLMSDDMSNILSLGGTVTATDLAGLKFNSGGQLCLEIADATHPGGVTQSAQTFGGIKTFSSGINIGAGVGITQAGSNFLSGAVTNSTFLGVGAGQLGTGNTFIGRNAGALMNGAGSNCTYVGYGAAANNIPAIGNCIAIGHNAAGTLINENNFIEISDGTFGTTIGGDIRIGMSASTRCFLGGILGVSVSSPAGGLAIDSTNGQLGVFPYGDDVTNYTMTLDVGSITTMTVRGASTTTLPIKLSLDNKVVTMRIPSFSLTAQTGAATTMNITGASTLASKYRPSFSSHWVIPFVDNATFKNAIVYITNGGAVTIQVMTGGPTFTLPSGPTYDIHLTWTIT